MKSYYDMAQSVLKRAQAEITHRKKRRAVIGSVAVGCLAVLTICLFVVGDDTPVFPSVGGPSSVVQRGFLQTVCYSDGAISAGSLEQSIPMQFVLETTDVQGRTETEIQQILQGKTQDWAQMEQTWTEAGYAYRISATYHQGGVVIVYATTGGFCLNVEDWTQVKEIRGRCESAYGKIQCAIQANPLSTKNITYCFTDEDGEEHFANQPVYRWGNCWIYGQSVIISGDALQSVYEDIQRGEGSLLFSWEPNQALFDALAADAEFDLPPISFSFTLCYRDGTEVEHRFTAESHDGIGYITHVE